MSDRTKIQWADATWNPITGCTKISQGCKNCYAAELHNRRHRAVLNGANLPAQYAKPFSEIQLHPDRLEMPLRWQRPRRIFVNSTSDLFHEDVPIEFVAQVFDVMASWPLRCRNKGCSHDDPRCWQRRNHVFMILTKRADRMQKIINEELPWYVGEVMPGDSNISLAMEHCNWPLPNVWLGVSAESQRAADERIPLLLQTPAAVRFVSCEPLLGPVDFDLTIRDGNGAYGYSSLTGRHFPFTPEPVYGNRLDWVIVGGESGPNARPMHPDWARSIRDQCLAAGVKFFFKQWGEWFPIEGKYHFDLDKPLHIWDKQTVSVELGKHLSGRILDGQEWNEYPGVSA